MNRDEISRASRLRAFVVQLMNLLVTGITPKGEAGELNNKDAKTLIWVDGVRGEKHT